MCGDPKVGLALSGDKVSGSTPGPHSMKRQKEMKNRVEKYITFQEIPPLAKTRRWYVLDRAKKPFALIKWYGGWRKYVCCFQGDSYCDSDCLQLIQEFLEKVNKHHRAQKKGVQ